MAEVTVLRYDTHTREADSRSAADSRGAADSHVRMGAGASAITQTADNSDTDSKLRAAVAVKLHVAGAAGAAPSDETNRQRVRDAFSRADGDSDGRLSFEEFASAAASIGLGVSEGDLRGAFSRFDADHDGSVDLEEVLAVLFGARSAGEIVATQQLARMAANAGAGRELSMVQDDVYAAVRKIATVIFEKELNLRKEFKRWDRDGSGALDRDELAHALNELGFSVGARDVETLYRAFDLDGDGRISCWELVKGIGSLTPELRVDEEAVERERQRREAQAAEAAAWLAATAELEAEARQFKESRRAAAKDAADVAAAADTEAAARDAAARAAAAARRHGVVSRTALFVARLRGGARRRRADELERARAAAEDASKAEAAAAAEAARLAVEQLAKAQAEAEEAEAAARAARLRRFERLGDATELSEMSAFAWKVGPLEAAKSDAEIIASLAARLQYVRVTADAALSQVPSNAPCDTRPSAPHTLPRSEVSPHRNRPYLLVPAPLTLR